MAAAKGISLGQLNAELYPDTGSARTVIDEGSTSGARLHAIDMLFYPDSSGTAPERQLPDVGCGVAADQCFGTAV